MLVLGSSSYGCCILYFRLPSSSSSLSFLPLRSQSTHLYHNSIAGSFPYALAGMSGCLNRVLSRRQDDARSGIFRAFAADGGGLSNSSARPPPLCAVPGPSQASQRVDDVKQALRISLEGLNRGIFGVDSMKKANVEELIGQLESLNPYPRPTDNMDLVKYAS